MKSKMKKKQSLNCVMNQFVLINMIKLPINKADSPIQRQVAQLVS